MEALRKSLSGITLKADDAAGTVRAVFSVFDSPDSDGDIVRRSAFTDGQTVPMVWSHEWNRPVGKGSIRVEDDRAVFDGQFNLATEAGREAYEAVKFMGDLQEWSWGFQITEVQPNPSIDGYDITGAEVFEVSPVLVGANRATHTLAVKGNRCPTCGQKAVSTDDATPADDEKPDDAQPAEPDWRLEARFALAAAELEV